MPDVPNQPSPDCCAATDIIKSLTDFRTQIEAQFLKLASMESMLSGIEQSGSQSTAWSDLPTPILAPPEAPPPPPPDCTLCDVVTAIVNPIKALGTTSLTLLKVGPPNLGDQILPPDPMRKSFAFIQVNDPGWITPCVIPNSFVPPVGLNLFSSNPYVFRAENWGGWVQEAWYWGNITPTDQIYFVIERYLK
jgi:hypothetical protein